MTWPTVLVSLGLLAVFTVAVFVVAVIAARLPKREEE